MFQTHPRLDRENFGRHQTIDELGVLLHPFKETATLVTPTSESDRFAVRHAAALSQLAADAFDGVALHDHERILDADERFASLFGYELDHVIGLPLNSMIEAGPAAEKSIGIRRDGSRFELQVTASEVDNPDHPGAIIGVRDITDRLLLEAQLEQANRVNGLGRLAATVAHEFNNVLMGIQPFAELMRKPGVSAATIASGAYHIGKSIARGKRVAKDILRFTHPAEPELQSVELAAWWKLLAPEIEASLGDNIDFSCSIPSSLSVNADASQLSQVFSNLVSNARDAMPHGGKLTVSARQPHAGETFPFGVVPNVERTIHLRIDDSGIGMSEDVRLHAFDPLFTTKQKGGTGLGLAVVHHVVTSHGGYIFVESAPDMGSTFHIFLPASNPSTSDE